MKSDPGGAVPLWVRAGQWIFTVGVVAGFLAPVAAFLGLGPGDWVLEGSFTAAVGRMTVTLPRFIPEAGAGRAPYGTVLLILASALLTAGAAAMVRHRWLFPSITGAGAVTVVIMAFRRSPRLADFGRAIGVRAVEMGEFLRDFWFGMAEPPEPVPGIILTAAAAALFARYAVQLARRRRRWEWALVLGALPYFNLWLYGGIRPMLWWFAVFAGSILLLAAGSEGLALASKGMPAGTRPFPIAAAWSQAAVFLVVTAVIASALPAEGSPRSWHWLNEQVQRIIPFAARGPGSVFGGLSSLGSFGGTGGMPGGGVHNLSDTSLMLGGPFQAAETEVMKVDIRPRGSGGTTQGLWSPHAGGPAAGATGGREPTHLLELADYELPPTLYMRGLTHTVYDGQSWSPGEQVSRRVIEPGGRGLTPGEAGQQLFSRGPFLVAIDQRIELVNLTTDVLFYVGMAFADPAGGYTQTAGGGIIADKVLRPSMVYTVPGYLPQSMPEGPDPFDDNSSLDIIGDHPLEHLPRYSPSGLTPEELAEYLALPDTVPGRVHRLAVDLTAGTGDMFRAARAIEGYLRRIPYETDVPFAPPDQDFVDHFLFDLQRGYCTHYASAMVVMLRSVGVPARLAHGFIVPADGAPPYSVTAAHAHVWPEAFIPGFGWVEFEPTAAYPSSAATWAATGLGRGADGAAGAGGPGGSVLNPDELERPTDDEFRLAGGIEIEHTPTEAAAEEEAAPIQRPAAAAAMAAAAALAAAVLVIWIIHARRRRLPPEPAAAAVKAYGLTRLYVGGAMAAISPPGGGPATGAGNTMGRRNNGWHESLTAGEFLYHVEQSMPALAEPVADLTHLYEPAAFGRPGGASPAAPPPEHGGAGSPPYDRTPEGGGHGGRDPSAAAPELILQEIVYRLAAGIGWWRAAIIQAFPNSPGLHRALFRR